MHNVTPFTLVPLITVGDLLKMLEHQDRSRVVVMQKDTEGNGGALPFCDIWLGSFNPETNKIGLEPADLTPDLREKGYSEDDIEDGPAALILYPRSNTPED